MTGDLTAARLDGDLERELAAHGERAGRVRLRLDVERVTDGATEAAGHRVLLLGVDDTVDPLPSL
ncbi:hypothetical protein [Streptomyces canus]|uniref:hypothetical protein n=1 Tax=Streptomyces canus TaxID=58343 RepID=UPI00036011DC|nr:hypothetical protein [Streptomyces canus]